MRFRRSILIFLLFLLAGVAAADVPGDRFIPGDRPVVAVDDLAAGRPLPGPLSAGDGGDSGDPFNDLARVLPLLVSQDAFESVYSLAADGYGDSDGDGVGRDKEGPLLKESSKDDLRIVSTEDGLLHLLNWETKKVVWSVNSGGPLYSAYQNRALLFGDHENGTKLGAKALVEPAPPEESHYVDFGNDGNLYVYTKIGKKRIGTSIETFISSTPHVSSEGIMTHGIRRQSFLKVDPITGQVLSSSLDNDLNTTLVMPSGGNQRALLSITRTDYELRGFYQDYNNTLWNMTFSKFDIYTFCSRDTHGLEYESDVASMFSCGMKIPVHALQINTQAPQILSLPSKDSLKNGEAIDSCEDGKSCLVKIDENGAQPVLGQPDFPIYKRVDWYLVFSVFVVLTVILLAIYLLKKRKWKEGEKVSSNTGRKHRVAIKKKKNQKASSTGSPIVITKKKNKFDNDNLQNHSHDSAQVGDSEFGDGIWVGELFVSNREIAIGSNGTVVYEGIQDRHRKVAVKRMLLSHNEVAIKEIDNLILSDHHPNIVRFYKREQDLNFVYLSLERCTCSLNDMIQMLEDNSTNSYLSKINIHIESLKGLTKDDFWQANGCPTSVLLNLMRDIVRGLAHLHQLGIVHRDLKPQNVLISQENTLRAKISDMGISKRLPSDMTSCHDPTGYGSSGWLAPEQIQHGRQTRAVDLFTLGCVLFFCVTRGKHPFGDRFERDMNITKNNVDLFLVEHLPEAVDLFSRLLNPNSELRPKANEVYNHPFFWDIGTRLSFLRDASDIIESEDKDTDSDILKAIEKIAPTALGCKWDEKLEAAFIDNIGRYRRYKYESVRDLLRVIRNKLNHYRDLPEDIQVLLGAVPGGFYNYFASRFPHLLIEVYKVIYKFCVGDEEDHRLVSKFDKKKELEFIRKYFTWVV